MTAAVVEHVTRKDFASGGNPARPGAGDDSCFSAERPFPGLRPFAFADRAFFFGREHQVYALYRLVESARFIAVIGSSGSGKSSLILAGLRALLAEEAADPNGTAWICREMRPGAAPLSRLAKAIAGLSESDSEHVETCLRQSSFSLQNAIDEAGGLGGKKLLLIVDQFEELFRFGLAGIGLKREGIQEAQARDEATQFVQILLDADRRRLEHVHVLITMRSDFIGDCAHFRGLSEAVSATQYLVPNLTRSQLEDAICKPIEKAGGSIEPELVERLLIDCGGELDQLPVLQHCLMRLWDRAGAAASDAWVDAPQTRERRITRQTYEEIGRIAGALSLHADELLRECAGRELAVQQALRALSELDRQGRAIRRPLRFNQLLAETGVAEVDLRAVLDRFRAPNCSFLLPPPSLAPVLAADDRIDIGHEAWLRRWKTMAGDPEAVDATTGRAPVGWLGEEQTDGRRYHTLVSMLEGEVGGERATLDDPADTSRWWKSVPRTAAWADRYGGRFDDVRKLIDSSIAGKQWNQTIRWTVAIVLLLAFVGVASFMTIQEWQKRTLQVERIALQAETISLQKKTIAIQSGTVLAAKAAEEMLQEFQVASVKGHIHEDSSRTLSRLIDKFGRDLRKAIRDLRTDKLWIKTLNVEADFASNLDDPTHALELALEAKESADGLVDSHPDDPEALQDQFDSLTRVGDACMRRLPEDEAPNFDRAIQEYTDALKVAERLASVDSGEKAFDDAVQAHLKLGDFYRKKKPSSPESAINEYREALRIISENSKFQNHEDAIRNRGIANYGIGVVLVDNGAWEEAFKAFDNARIDQELLVKRFDDDETLKPDLAASYVQLGNVLAKENALSEARKRYSKGVDLQEKIIAKNPLVPRYRERLDSDYEKFADVLDKLKLPDDLRMVRFQTYRNLKELVDIHKDMDDIDKERDEWQARFARAAKRVGDYAKLPEFQLARYREALETWTILSGTEKGLEQLRGDYGDLIRVAEAFFSANDWTEAKTAYQTALNVAGMNLKHDPTSADWRNVERAETGAANAARALESQPPTARQ